MQMGEKEESSPAAKLIVHGRSSKGIWELPRTLRDGFTSGISILGAPPLNWSLTMAPPESGTIAVLAEKPSVARDIARVLGATSKGDGYLHGNGYVVA